MATITSQFGEPLAGEVTFEQPGETLTQRRMAQIFFATFWTIIFTGSVRKWLFPGVSAFYALQEIPITIAYAYAIYKGAYLRGMLFFGIIFLCAAVTFQALMQVIGIGLTPFIAVIGLHHYLYYMPMMLVFPLCLTPRYRRDFILWNIWSALPMVLLSLAQATTPTGSWVNRTSDGEGAGLPGVEVARITGPFNFAVYYGIWMSIALSLCIGEWLLPPERRATRNNLLLATATFCWIFIAFISGSRQNILLCGTGVAGAVIVAITIRSTRGIAIIALGALSIPVIAGAVYVVSPTEFQTIYSRFTDTKSNSSYDIKGRIGSSFYGWLTDPEYSLIGKGVGLGVDAAHFGQANTNVFTYSLAEADTIRNVMELGTPVGYLWSILRFGFAFGMIALGWRLIRYSTHCLPLACALFAQVGAELTRYSTMTYTQVMIGYSFIFGVSLFPEFFEQQPSLPSPSQAPVFDERPEALADPQ